MHHLCHSSAAHGWHAHQVSGSDEEDIDKESKKQRRKTRLSDVAGRPPGSPARSPAQMQSKAAGSSQPSAIPAVYYSREFPSGDEYQAQAKAMHASRLLATPDSFKDQEVQGCVLRLGLKALVSTKHGESTLHKACTHYMRGCSRDKRQYALTAGRQVSGACDQHIHLPCQRILRPGIVVKKG